jgi:hypothetical protein
MRTFTKSFTTVFWFIICLSVSSNVFAEMEVLSDDSDINICNTIDDGFFVARVCTTTTTTTVLFDGESINIKPAQAKYPNLSSEDVAEVLEKQEKNLPGSKSEPVSFFSLDRVHTANVLFHDKENNLVDVKSVTTPLANKYGQAILLFIVIIVEISSFFIKSTKAICRPAFIMGMTMLISFMGFYYLNNHLMDLYSENLDIGRGAIVSLLFILIYAVATVQIEVSMAGLVLGLLIGSLTGFFFSSAEINIYTSIDVRQIFTGMLMLVFIEYLVIRLRQKFMKKEVVVAT